MKKNKKNERKVIRNNEIMSRKSLLILNIPIKTTSCNIFFFHLFRFYGRRQRCGKLVEHRTGVFVKRKHGTKESRTVKSRNILKTGPFYDDIKLRCSPTRIYYHIRHILVTSRRGVENRERMSKKGKKIKPTTKTKENKKKQQIKITNTQKKMLRQEVDVLMEVGEYTHAHPSSI